MDLTLSTSEKDKDNALYPLLHFVLDDLPESTKSPNLDDSNAQSVIDGTNIVCGRMEDLVGLYLAYLVKVGFLPEPVEKCVVGEEKSGVDISRKRKLPCLMLDGEVRLLKRSER